MPTPGPFDVAQLDRLYVTDAGRLELARQRQRAVWAGQRPDRWPIVLSAGLSAAQQSIPAPDLQQAFADPDLMLCSQVRAACSVANAGADGVPSVRGNYGVGVLLSCLGLGQEVFPDRMPWPRQHFTREQIARVAPDDIGIRGTFEVGLRFMRGARQVLQDRLPVYCMDTQGPPDLAHLLVGDDFFLLMHDDPGLAHHVLEIALELGLRTHAWMKQVSGEPLAHMHHSNSIYTESMGIRICEDTTAIIGPAAVDEFAVPYTVRLARHFGGAWLHYCGRNDHLTRVACALPEIRGINFGHIPGHEHDHVFEEDMQRCLDSRTVYFGPWPRRPGESGRAYLQRLHAWARRGCLIPVGDAAVGAGGFADATAAVDFWYSL
jgi:hypothetical protein